MNVLGIFSGKGGVGKSTVAVNLAVSFSQFGRNVALVDFNFGMPNVSHFFGKDHLPGLSDYASGKLTEDEIIYSYDPTLKIVPSGIISGENMNLSNIDLILNTLKNENEIVLVDMPLQNSLYFNDLIKYVNYGMIVTNNSKSSLLSIHSQIDILSKNSISYVGCVLNNTEYNNHNSQLINDLGIDFVMKLPHENHFSYSLSKGVPFVDLTKHHHISESFKTLSANMLGESYNITKDLSFSNLIKAPLGLMKNVKRRFK
jgi:flagellar biosynthesis protein FlhG